MKHSVHTYSAHLLIHLNICRLPAMRLALNVVSREVPAPLGPPVSSVQETVWYDCYRESKQGGGLRQTVGARSLLDWGLGPCAGENESGQDQGWLGRDVWARVLTMTAYPPPFVLQSTSALTRIRM